MATAPKESRTTAGRYPRSGIPWDGAHRETTATQVSTGGKVTVEKHRATNWPTILTDRSQRNAKESGRVGTEDKQTSRRMDVRKTQSRITTHRGDRHYEEQRMQNKLVPMREADHGRTGDLHQFQ